MDYEKLKEVVDSILEHSDEIGEALIKKWESQEEIVEDN